MDAPAPVEPDEHAALRADIRRLGNLLGESLVRQEGPELLDLVERVRGLARSDPEALGQVLESLDLPTAAKLCRAFGTYFHLANVTEQVHRARTMSSERQDKGSWLAQAVDRISDSGLDTEGGRRAGVAGRRPPDVHRPSHRGSPPLDPVQAPAGGRAAGDVRAR